VRSVAAERRALLLLLLNRAGRGGRRYGGEGLGHQQVRQQQAVGVERALERRRDRLAVAKIDA